MARSLLSEQLHELLNGESCIRDDPTECAGTDLLVVGNDSPGVWIVPAEDHVAAGLATENEAGALQRGADITSGKIGGEFGHVLTYPFSMRFPRLRGLDFNEFLASLCRDRIAGVTAILQVKLNGLSNICQGLRAIVALGYTARQRWDAGNVPAVFFLFQNDRVAHGDSPVAL